MSEELPVQLADLPAPVAAAVARAAERISAWTEDNNYVPRITPKDAERLITEELRPVLLGGPLPPFANVERTTSGPWTLADLLLLSPQRSGCVGSRYCHACKISYGGTCLCLPNKCHECGAECGTTPPPEGEKWPRRTHY